MALRRYYKLAANTGVLVKPDKVTLVARTMLFRKGRAGYGIKFGGATSAAVSGVCQPLSTTHPIPPHSMAPLPLFSRTAWHRAPFSTAQHDTGPLFHNGASNHIYGPRQGLGFELLAGSQPTHASNPIQNTDG